MAAARRLSPRTTGPIRQATRATPYYKSKTLAERAAWDFAGETGLDLAVINPGIIFGPLLGRDYGTSVGLIQQMMSGKLQARAALRRGCRRCARCSRCPYPGDDHPEASGQRFIAAGKFFWMRDIAVVLARSFPAYASKLPSGEVPNWMIRMMAPFSARSRMIVHELDRDLSVSAAKAKRVLGWQPRPEEEAIRASAQSLIDHGLVATS